MNPEETNQVVDEAPTEAVLTEESLIEEVSIDGMCGVY
ncbi:mycofactocin precursor MftA [Nocardioides sp. NPDC101246]|nr:mycofactocin precursor MftA [Nocardioides sp. YR527]SDK66131.1 mycofactocin precursor [Nocardioides sp. YR527]